MDASNAETQRPDEASLVQIIDDALSRGDPAAALDTATEALRQAPANLAVQRKYAHALRLAGRAADARDVLDPLHRDRPQDIGLALDLAQSLHMLRDFDATDRLLADILQIDPRSLAARVLQIDVALARGTADSALARSEDALAQLPDSVPLLRKRAHALRLAERGEEAFALLTDLHRRRPQDNGIALDLARTLHGLGAFDRAEDLLDAALENAPADLGVLVLHVDIALARGAAADALCRADAALALRPGALPLVRKRAHALRLAGRAQAARDALTPLYRTHPGDTGLALDLAQTLTLLGAHEEVEHLLVSILATDPEDLGALVMRIDTALARDDAALALARADAALARRPGSLPLLRKRAHALRLAGHAQDSHDLLMPLHLAHPHDEGIVLELAQSLKALGAETEADHLLDRILQADRGNLAAGIARIDMALGRGDADAALALSEEALTREPDSLPLLRKRAHALRLAGRAQDARDILAPLHANIPQDRGVALDLAQTLHLLGEHDQADALLAGILEKAPSDWPALRERARIADARRAHERAIALLDLDPAEGDDGPDEVAAPTLPVPPERVLTLLEFDLKTGVPARLDRWRSWIEARLHALDDEGLTRLMRIAERADRPDLTARVIEQVRTRRTLTPSLALAVLRPAAVSGQPQLAADLRSALAPRVARAARDSFWLEAVQMCEGPLHALARARSLPVPGRTPREAVALARLLMAAGRNRLAMRYVLRCVRRWPNAAAIRSVLIAACLQAGHPETAQAWLADQRIRLMPEEYEALRLRILLETGALSEAVQIIEAQIASGQRALGEMHILLPYLALGRLDRAEEIARALRHDLRRSTKETAHFQTSHFGALLNELRLFRMAVPQGGGASTSRGMAGSYFHAASEVLDAWETNRAPATPTGRNDLPRRIFQYWNANTIPAEVAEVMRSWQDVAEWQYRRFDREGALDWLARHYDADHVRAFRLARHVAEESDFFRLCFLLKEGGIYADADDLRVGHPAAIAAEGHGAILFREPYRAVANNLLCAPPGHPLFRRAVGMVRNALLQRDNDSTWPKTGPGLLTRACALHVLEDPQKARRDMTLVPQSRMRRHIHPHIALPYKNTAQYWNPGATRTPDIVMRALHDLARHDPLPSAPDGPGRAGTPHTA